MKKFSPLSYVSMSTVNAMVSALLMDRTTAKLKIISDQPLVDFLSPSALEKANTSKQGLDLRKLSPELFVLLHAAFGNAAVPSRDKWDNYIVFRIPMSLEVKFVGHDIGVSMGGEGDSPGLTLSFHPFKKTPEAKAASIHAAEKLFHFMVEAEPMFDEKIKSARANGWVGKMTSKLTGASRGNSVNRVQSDIAKSQLAKSVIASVSKDSEVARASTGC